MPVHNSRYLKASNRRRILRLIRRGPVARSELAFETGLTRAAMTRIVGDLIEEGLLVESGRLLECGRAQTPHRAIRSASRQQA